MALPFVGEIRFIASDRLPDGWAHCDGQMLAKSGYISLSGALGEAFGGDGMDNFALPDLRSRVPLQVSPGHAHAQAGGRALVVLDETDQRGVAGRRRAARDDCAAR